MKNFNIITIKNKKLLPLVQEILNRLTKTKYFTKLNFVAAFKKIKMVANEKWKTVFRLNFFFRIFNHEFRFCGTTSTLKIALFIFYTNI